MYRLILPVLLAGCLLAGTFALLPSPPALAQPGHIPAAAPAALTATQVYTYTLTSGNVAAVELSATAGEIFVGSLLLVLVFDRALYWIFKLIFRRPV